jgi:hypothetical protein
MHECALELDNVGVIARLHQMDLILESARTIQAIAEFHFFDGDFVASFAIDRTANDTRSSATAWASWHEYMIAKHSTAHATIPFAKLLKVLVKLFGIVVLNQVTKFCASKQSVPNQPGQPTNQPGQPINQSSNKLFRPTFQPGCFLVILRNQLRIEIGGRRADAQTKQFTEFGQTWLIFRSIV